MQNWSLDELLSFIKWGNAEAYCHRYVFGRPDQDIFHACRVDQAEAVSRIEAGLDYPFSRAFLETCLASSLLLAPSEFKYDKQPETISRLVLLGNRSFVGTLLAIFPGCSCNR